MTSIFPHRLTMENHYRVSYKNTYKETTRHRNNHPIKRSELIQLLEQYNSGGVSYNGTPIFVNSPITVLGNESVVNLFSTNSKVMDSFLDAGGLVIRTDIVCKHKSRKRVLTDVDVWHLWDIINIQSGWFVLDIDWFNSIVANECSNYLALTNCNLSLVDKNNVLEYSPCFMWSIDIGYKVLFALFQLFQEYVKLCGLWSDKKSRIGDDEEDPSYCQESYHQYQLMRVESRIHHNQSAADILVLLIELLSVTNFLSNNIEYEYRDIFSYSDCCRNFTQMVHDLLCFELVPNNIRDQIAVICDLDNIV